MEFRVLKIINAFFRDMARDYPELCAELDAVESYVSKRYLNEGIYFLTSVLPSLSTTLLECIESDSYGPMRSFTAIDDRSPFRVLIGLLGIGNYRPSDSTISHHCLGTALSVKALTVLRQICELWKKIAYSESPPVLVDSTIGSFLEMNVTRGSFEPPDMDHCLFAKRIVDVCFSEKLEKGFQEEIMTSNACRNGPGTVSGLYSRKKFVFSARTTLGSNSSGSETYDVAACVIPEEDPLVPFAMTALASGNEVFSFKKFKDFFTLDESPWYHNRYPSENLSKTPEGFDWQPVCELVAVPKSATKLRLIAKEDRYKLRSQAPFMDFLFSFIKDELGMDLRDQSGNQKMALFGSCNNKIATLDVKDGSNCVLHTLSNYIFGHLKFYKALEGTVSRFFVLPHNYRGFRPKEDMIVFRGSDGRKVLAYKNHSFSAQGSFVCFPWLVLYLTVAILVETIMQDCSDLGVDAQNLSDSQLRELVNRMIKQIQLFGDDIIVPVRWADRLIDNMEKYWFVQINRQKTYYKSQFRESCGLDAFHGKVVTPMRIPIVYDAVSGGKLAITPSDSKVLQWAIFAANCWQYEQWPNIAFTLMSEACPVTFHNLNINDHYCLASKFDLLRSYSLHPRNREGAVYRDEISSLQLNDFGSSHHRYGKPFPKDEHRFLVVFFNYLLGNQVCKPSKCVHRVRTQSELNSYLSDMEHSDTLRVKPLASDRLFASDIKNILGAISDSLMIEDSSILTYDTVDCFMDEWDLGRCDRLTLSDVPRTPRISLPRRGGHA